MAHELEPVLAFKESLEQAQGRMSDCRQALDNAIEKKRGDAEEIDYAFRDIAKSLESKTFEILHELGKRISLFERKSSVGGSVHSSKAATSVKVLEKCTKNLIGHSRLAFNNHESNIDC